MKSERWEAFLTIYDETLRARAADPLEEGAGCESTAKAPGHQPRGCGKTAAGVPSDREGRAAGHGAWDLRLGGEGRAPEQPHALVALAADSSRSSKSATHLIWAALEFSRNQSTVSFEKYMDLALERNCPASASDLTAMVTPPSRWLCRTRAGSPGRRR